MNVLNSSTNAVENSSNAAAEAPAPPGSGSTVTTTSAKKAKVQVTFISRSSDAVLMVACERVIVAMSGNAAYPSPSPTVATLTAARTAFIAAVNAGHDSKLARATRRQLRQNLEGLLREMALYVQVTSNGDLPTLLASGFPAQRQRSPVGLLEAPGNLRLERGKLGGQIVARCKRVDQAGAYQWRYAVGNAVNGWVLADPTLAARTTLTGLVPGTQYTVQVRSIGTSGPSEWSDVAVLMAA